MSKLRFIAIGALSGAALLVSLPASAQRLTVRPGPEVVAGDPLHLAIDGAQPAARLTVRASRIVSNAWGTRPFQSQAVFVADAAGHVDVDTQAPVDGSYRGADARGLFWSMQPAAADAPLPALDAARSGEVVLQLLLDGKPIAEQRVRLLPQAADVTVTEVAQFPGARFATQGGATRRPALIVLGGSEGGSATARSMAALLASHGYAVVGLPYYSPGGWGPQGPTPPELPTLPGSFVDIELSRLVQVRDWLAKQPGVDAGRIGVYGVSKGAEFALAAASRMPWIRAVAAVVPSDVVWEGWGPAAPQPDQRASFAWQGQALPFVPYQDFAQEFANASRGQPVILRRAMDQGRAAHPGRVAAARIAVEQIAAPVLLVGGGDDQVWDSAGMAQAIATQRDGLKQPTTVLLYPQAGHGVMDHGWNVTTTYQDSFMKLGGSAEADARAQADAWPRLLAFFSQSL